MTLPRMVRLRQALSGPRLDDVPASVRGALAGTALPVRRGDVVAVGAGSRGIANIATIVGTAVRHLQDLGARPFVFPAMGSHGGGTAEGQLEVLAHYGITEDSMGCPVRATMEVVQVGETLGMPVWLDRFASEADWIGLVNRVKPHTDFKGGIESGLFKMMTIGLGKYRGAIQYHKANIQHGYETVITAVGREMLEHARLAFGLAVVENGHDQTAQVEAFTATDLESGERRLLACAKEWMARLPFDRVDVLIVEEMGKNISGAGMDTKVVNRAVTGLTNCWPNTPRIERVFIRDISDISYGNGVGLGMADVVCDRLLDKIDWVPTRINSLTASTPAAIKTPAHFRTDRECLEAMMPTVGKFDMGEVTICRIRNTMQLNRCLVSGNLLPQLRKNPLIEVLEGPMPMEFDSDGNLTEVFREARELAHA